MYFLAICRELPQEKKIGEPKGQEVDVFLVGDLFNFLIMVVDYVIFEAKVFEDELIIDFCCDDESFMCRLKSRSSYYVE